MFYRISEPLGREKIYQLDKIIPVHFTIFCLLFVNVEPQSDRSGQLRIAKKKKRVENGRVLASFHLLEVGQGTKTVRTGVKNN